MIALRLFSAADPSRQIDVRVLGEREEVTIGRDAAAGWALADPDRALSRLHLKVGVRDGAVSVTDTSTNGVTSAAREERLPRDQPVRVEPGERLELGPYVLLIERSDHVSAPAPRARREDANPFAPEGEVDEPPEPRRRVDPFASGMAPDPLAADPFADDGLGLSSLGRAPERSNAGLSDGDAWERRNERPRRRLERRPRPGRAVDRRSPGLEGAPGGGCRRGRLRLRRPLPPADPARAGPRRQRPRHPLRLGRRAAQSSGAGGPGPCTRRRLLLSTRRLAGLMDRSRNTSLRLRMRPKVKGAIRLSSPVRARPLSSSNPLRRRLPLRCCRPNPPRLPHRPACSRPSAPAPSWIPPPSPARTRPR